MPGSVAGQSVGGSSTRSRTYRTVGRNADVDETLFGSTSLKNRTMPARENDKEIQIVGKDTVQVRKKFAVANRGGGKQDAVIIPASELNRLREKRYSHVQGGGARAPTAAGGSP
eukprot:SRR837773.16627.p2 GENE.SRR837773.16627~~SRR837773.16627.p2  ORF type:complete len:114 (-),score=9.14 SRR837773.16627:56-397(-)